MQGGSPVVVVHLSIDVTVKFIDSNLEQSNGVADVSSSSRATVEFDNSTESNSMVEQVGALSGSSW